MSRWLPLWVAVLAAGVAHAGPYLEAGDLALRHDVQRLAEVGVIKGTTSAWPLAWAPLLADIRTADATALPADARDALARLQRRARWETRTDGPTFDGSLGVADNPTRIRSFQNTPRGKLDVAAGVNWMGSRFAADVNVQYVDSDGDDEDIRFDNSLLGVAIGNWSIAASTQERWWGPSWDGSLILSNNARPFPSFVIDRLMTDAFETKWLSWIGPWDLNIMFGQLEEERAIPNAQFFGMRFSFRPIHSLEIGLSRSAQWCGDDRPCDASTFVDLLLGRDNLGDDDIEENSEPGNQLAGFDFRWSPGAFGNQVGVYGQFVGEDEAGGFPSRWMGQFGIDASTYLFERWSTRVYGEFSATSCQFYESSELFNCAYNHGIYKTGYRYRGRAIGHGADNDARIVSAGAVLVDVDDVQWRLLARYGELNRGGAPDPANTLTPTPQDFVSLDVAHSRAYKYGVFEVGLGFESVDPAANGNGRDDFRAYLQWKSSF